MIRRSYILFLLLIQLLLWTGCNDTDITDNSGTGTSKELYEAYVSINLRTLAEEQTRSNPTGGEKGDGEEEAFDYESKINNLTVLFFPGSDLNSSLNTEIAGSLYIGPEDILTTTTKVQKVKLGKEIYHLIVIANAGDQTVQLEGLKVKEVADLIWKEAWKVTGSTYSDFIMTSASESFVDLTINTTESKPAKAEVALQRMAARVDILPKQDEEGVYTINENKEEIAKVILQKARLVNRLTAGSYFLKRVANSINAIPTYLGKETPVSGNQSNYVLDPWIAMKTAGNLSGNHFDITNGGIGASPAHDLYADYFVTSFTLTTADAIKSPLAGEDFYILNYVLENTLEQNNQLNGYSTGIVYETVYTPLKIVQYNSSSLNNEVVTNDKTITFFALDNSNTIYNSPEALTQPFLEGNQADDFFSHLFTTANTVQELYNYAQRLNENDPLGFRNYLNSLIADKNRKDRLDRNVSWHNYLLTVYGINSSNVLTINQNGIDTKLTLRQQGVKLYENGLCYYTYWLRHSNNNSIDSAIMEFGIVRNNIYKLQVLSFSALGKPFPYDPETDNPENQDEESLLRVVIYVKPWNLISHREIVF